MNEKFIENDVIIYENKQGKIIRCSGCPIGSSMNFYDIEMIEDKIVISNVPESEIKLDEK